MRNLFGYSDNTFLTGKNILVTGAAGFLGERLCEHLGRRGCVLFGIDRDPIGPGAGFGSIVTGDLADQAERCIEEFEPAVVFHLAGASSVPDSVRDPFTDFDSAMPGTARLLAAAARAANPPRVVYFSSAAVYGDPAELPVRETAPVRPISPYGVHKAACEAMLEHYARIYGLRVSILRVFSAYGEGLRRQFFWDFACRALEANARSQRQVSLLGTGAESRDFIHADDIASAACLAAQSLGDGVEVFNVAAGEETTIAWAAERMLALLGLDLEFRFDGEGARGNPKRWLADTSRLRALGFHPKQSLDDRLPALANWIAAQRAPAAVTGR